MLCTLFHCDCCVVAKQETRHDCTCCVCNICNELTNTYYSLLIFITNAYYSYVLHTVCDFVFFGCILSFKRQSKLYNSTIYGITQYVVRPHMNKMHHYNQHAAKHNANLKFCAYFITIGIQMK